MAWSESQATTDFEDLQLAEFGESVIFINGTTGAQTRISAVRNTIRETQPGLNNSTTSQNRLKPELLISPNAISTIKPDIDSIKLRVSPNDSFDKTLLIRYAKNEYGVWRVGLA